MPYLGVTVRRTDTSAFNPRERKTQYIAFFEDIRNILRMSFLHKQAHNIILYEFYANFEKRNILRFSRSRRTFQDIELTKITIHVTIMCVYQF